MQVPYAWGRSVASIATNKTQGKWTIQNRENLFPLYLATIPDDLLPKLTSFYPVSHFPILFSPSLIQSLTTRHELVRPCKCHMLSCWRNSVANMGGVVVACATRGGDEPRRGVGAWGEKAARLQHEFGDEARAAQPQNLGAIDRYWPFGRCQAA